MDRSVVRGIGAAMVAVFGSLVGCSPDRVVTPEAEPGRLALHSVPEGARVFVLGERDGRPVEFPSTIAPDTLVVPRGHYEVTFTLEGHGSRHRVVWVGAGDIAMAQADFGK